MPTANEALQDSQIAHAVGLQRYSTGVVRRILALLNRTDADLVAQLQSALDRLPAESFTVERLEALLGSLRALNAQAYQAVGLELAAELRALAEYEAGFQLQLFAAAIPAQVIAQVAISGVNVEQAYSAAMARPFQGRLLSEWSQSLQADRAARIRDTIRIGYIENQTISQIVQRVRGTRAKGYSDGIIEIDRRNAEAVVRTAVSHTAGFVRDRFYEANDDLIKAVVWTATLDSRTTHVCRLRDGKQYTNLTHKPIGHAYPWIGGPGAAHWRCRSVGVPVLKSYRELGIPLDELSPGTRASMGGQVPVDLSYGEWLKKQSATRQDDVLGATKGALFRRGELPIERFADSKGRELSIAELRQRDAAAFERAGL